MISAIWRGGFQVQLWVSGVKRRENIPDAYLATVLSSTCFNQDPVMLKDESIFDAFRQYCMKGNVLGELDLGVHSSVHGGRCPRRHLEDSCICHAAEVRDDPIELPDEAFVDLVAAADEKRGGANRMGHWHSKSPGYVRAVTVLLIGVRDEDHVFDPR